MDRIAKFLKKLTPKERKITEEIIALVSARDFSGLDIKKLKGSVNIFRIRKGNIRVIFLKEGSQININSIGRRSDTTY